MSPTLSRENYFLTVINQIKEHTVEAGSLEEELQQLLLDLARLVQANQSFSEAVLERINSSFERYPAVHLKIKSIPQEEPAIPEPDSTKKSAPGVRPSLLLYTQFVDGPDQLRRMYMEALISLLEALERKPIDLQTCTQCGSWFIPYERASVTRFCSTKCRNRYHYLLGKINRQEATS